MNKLEIRKKRQEVLANIHKILYKCDCQESKEARNRSCKNCKEIRNLGAELDKLLVARRKHRINDSKYKVDRKAKIAWTDAMEDELREMASQYTSVEVAKLLGMTREQISNKCSKMGIKCKRTVEQYKYYEDGKFVAKGTVKEIASQIGYEYNVLFKYTKKQPVTLNRKMVLVNE